MVRASGSYPLGPRFDSRHRHHFENNYDPKKAPNRNIRGSELVYFSYFFMIFLSEQQFDGCPRLGDHIIFSVYPNVYRVQAK